VTQKEELRNLEQLLLRVYLKIWREIQKEPDYPNNLYGLKEKYGRLVYDNTRAVVQQAVIIGIEQVNRRLKSQAYITKKDIEIIEKNTDLQVASFWRKVQLASDDERRRLLGGSISDYFSAAAISSVFSSVADAIVSKVGQVVDLFGTQEKPMLRWETLGDNKVCPICAALNGMEFTYDDAKTPGPETDGGSSHYNCRCQLFVL